MLAARNSRGIETSTGPRPHKQSRKHAPLWSDGWYAGGYKDFPPLSSRWHRPDGIAENMSGHRDADGAADKNSTFRPATASACLCQRVPLTWIPWERTMVPITGRMRQWEASAGRVESKTAASRGPSQPRDVRTVTEPISREIYNPVQRDRVVFVKMSSETGGEVTLADMEVAPGGGNPLHFHTTFSERFTVEEGEFGAQIGRRRLALHAGESELVRPRVVHRWFNASDRPVRVRLELRPGNEGFERALRIIYGLASDGLTNSAGIPKSLLHLAVLAQMGDTRLAGLKRPLNLLFGLLALVAHRRGVDAELARRYGV